MRTQEWVGVALDRELLGHGGATGGAALAHGGDARAQRGAVGLERGREAEVVLGVLVRAEDPRVAGQRREPGEAFEHRGRRPREEVAAAAGEERVAGEREIL